MLDRKGVIYKGRTEGIDQWKSRYAIKTQHRTLEDAVKGYEQELILAKIDIDQNQNIAAQLRIQSIPTVYTFFEGKVVDGFQGAKSKSEIIEFVKKSASFSGPGKEVEDLISSAKEFIEKIEKNNQISLKKYYDFELDEIIKSSNNSNLKTVKIIGNFHGTLSYERQRKVIKKFGWSFRLAGFDALNYCLLAEGTVDAVIEANLKPYDILPLIPIIKNSGAIVTNWKNEPAEIGGNIIASSNKALHNKILRLLKPFTKK